MMKKNQFKIVTYFLKAHKKLEKIYIPWSTKKHVQCNLISGVWEDKMYAHLTEVVFDRLSAQKRRYFTTVARKYQDTKQMEHT